MKFTIQKQFLVNACDKMCEVATKGIKSDFKLACRLQIDAQDSVSIKATNGHLFAQYNLPLTDTGCVITEKGSVILDASVCREIVRTIGGAGAGDHSIELETVDNALRLRDTSTKSRKWSKLQTLTDSQTFTIQKPRKRAEYKMQASDFCRPCQTLWKYHTIFEYDTQFTLVCLHFLSDKTRFVCGDGSFFGVWEIRSPAKYDDSLPEKERLDQWVLPANQASIIASILNSEGEITLQFPDPKQCFISTGNIDMHLKGIPEIAYIQYATHAFRFGDAQAVIDVKREDFLDAVASVKAVRDKEGEKEGDFHSCRFEAKDGEMILSVPKGKYSCEFQLPASYYKVNHDSFVSEYSWDFLNNVATAASCDYIRFYSIDPTGIILAEQLNLNDAEKDSRVPVDCPASKDKDVQITFFFACATEEEPE